MTDQPTTWTPERALAMLRDLNDDAIEGPAFLAKWGSEFDPEQVAMEALESAAAEIERQKARADELAEKIVARLGRVDRKESPEDALERLLASHAEKLHEVDRLRAELAAKQPAEAAQQGPSDEEIRDAVNSILKPGNDWERAQAIVAAFIAFARRAGVKL